MTLREIWLTTVPKVVCRPTLKRRSGRPWKDFMRTHPLACHRSNNSWLFCLTTGLALCLTTSAASAASWLVHDAAEFATAASALQPGDEIVLVGVTSAHRGSAFSAAEFIMDYLKTRAPFWKREATEQGDRWVDARDSDHQAAQRWD